MWPPSRFAGFEAGLVLLATLGLGSARASGEGPLIADLKWIHAGADVVAELTTKPAECLAPSADPGRAQSVRLGRVAFRSPALLGGLAARVGMSCDSCHRNGHDNPVFHFSGVSEEPGTADVTGNVFSRNRDDGRRNPVRIPSLVDAGSAAPFGTVRPASDLATFLRAVVIDEFQGVAPAPSVLLGMVAYLESLRSAACPERRLLVVSFEADARELVATLEVVIETLDGSDLHGGLFALASLRAALGRLYRRFPESIPARADLIELSRSLSRVRHSLEREEIASATSLWTGVRERLELALEKLAAHVEASFYSPDVLRRTLDGPRE